MIKFFQLHYKFISAIFLVLLFLNLNKSNLIFVKNDQKQYQLTISFKSMGNLIKEIEVTENFPNSSSKNVILNWDKFNLEDNLYREIHMITINQLFNYFENNNFFVKTSCGRSTSVNCFYIIIVPKNQNIEKIINEIVNNNIKILESFLRLKDFQFIDKKLPLIKISYLNETNKVKIFLVVSLLLFIVLYFVIIKVIKKINLKKLKKFKKLYR